MKKLFNMILLLVPCMVACNNNNATNENEMKEEIKDPVINETVDEPEFQIHESNSTYYDYSFENHNSLDVLNVLLNSKNFLKIDGIKDTFKISVKGYFLYDFHGDYYFSMKNYILGDGCSPCNSLEITLQNGKINYTKSLEGISGSTLNNSFESFTDENSVFLEKTFQLNIQGNFQYQIIQ